MEYLLHEILCTIPQHLHSRPAQGSRANMLLDFFLSQVNIEFEIQPIVSLDKLFNPCQHDLPQVPSEICRPIISLQDYVLDFVQHLIIWWYIMIMHGGVRQNIGHRKYHDFSCSCLISRLDFALMPAY